MQLPIVGVPFPKTFRFGDDGEHEAKMILLTTQYTMAFDDLVVDHLVSFYLYTCLVLISMAQESSMGLLRSTLE
jgi:hypothetical protein